MSEETQGTNGNQGSSTGRTVLIVVLIVLGAIIVLFVGALIGNALGGGNESETAPEAPTVAPPEPPADSAYLVATANVNVRSGPGLDYPIYGVMPQGEEAEIIGVSSDYSWWQIKIPTGYSPDGTGWVSADYTTAYNTDNVPVVGAPPAPPTVPTTAPPPSGEPYVVTTDVVNVRSGPGNQYDSYGVVPLGTTFPALGLSEDGKWVAVTIPTNVAPDGVGWVNTAYVDLFDASSLGTYQ